MKRPRSLRRYTARPFGDQTLRALAQLAAYRLNYKRAYVSIFNGEEQHVVARAQTSSDLTQLSTSIEEEFEIECCAKSIRCFRGEKLDVDGHADESAVLLDHGYFSVPIKCTAGVVGVLSVLEPATRASLEDTSTLAEVADLIMHHLEMTCVVEDHQRAEKLLAGISQFLQGKDSLAGSPVRALNAENDETETDAVVPDSTPQHVKHVFSRASNLIRECMDLDATCFLEVPGNERYKSTRRTRGTTSDMIAESESSTISDIDLDSIDSDTTSDRTCQRLGYSTPNKSSLLASVSTTQFLSMPARLLNILQSKYPRGRIFHFDHQTSSSSDDEKRLRRNITSELSKLYPNASSMIFYPLYDNERQHIYAGFVGWTVNPMRTLQKHEIVYVSGFANSIMCEVMRLESLAMDKAKSNFISSISHELRSPLHGILAANQLNDDNEYVQMVDICGRTLLDTMDQLLDYAKINSFTQRKLGKRTHSLVADADIATLVEETVMSLVAGQKHDHAIPVFVNLSHPDKWTFKTEAGSWRRIILNIVGNALKYTQTGYILVDLTANLGEQHIAYLKISDTGQGISEAYLKHRLYTPFAQEDNHSVGAGLGLSIINQIVSSLHGQMQISSKVGQGTQISVQIPLEHSAIQTQNPKLPDLTFKMFGFTGSRVAETAGTSIQNTLEQWLDMKTSTEPNIFIIEELFLQADTSFDSPDKRLLIIRLGPTTSHITHAPHFILASPFGPSRLSKAITILRTKRSAPSPTQTLETPRRTTAILQATETQLLVDDNDINLRLLVACAKGHPLTATNGLEAVEKYKSSTASGVRITIVLLDVSMPVMDGFEAARQIRAFEAENNIKPAKIVAITGLASEEAQTKVEECGFDLYFRKPVDMKTVKRLLRNSEK